MSLTNVCPYCMKEWSSTFGHQCETKMTNENNKAEFNPKPFCGRDWYIAQGLIRTDKDEFHSWVTYQECARLAARWQHAQNAAEIAIEKQKAKARGDSLLAATEKIQSLQADLAVAKSVLERIQSGFGGMFGDQTKDADEEALEVIPVWVDEALAKLEGRG